MYQSQYKKKLMSPEQATELVKSHQTIVHGMGSAEPPALLNAIADRIKSRAIEKLKVFSLLPMESVCNTLLAKELSEQVQAYTWFISKGDRELVHIGIDQFVPCNFHEVPRLCKEFMEIDVCVTTVSPMDKSGFFSFGAVNDYTSTAARSSKKLIVEVNENMPRVFGDSLLHLSEVDAIVENNAPLLEIAPAEAKPEDEIIGRAIAEMVPDHSVIQLGFGGIPNSVAQYLKDHKDLGIHSELLCPGMIDLIRQGVITGRRKNIHPRKHVFTNAFGTKDLYDFIDDNPSMESYPVSYTNDPAIIRENRNMVSINATIEVDLTGQCNSEYMLGEQYSGTGGQLDFVRGAFHSERGKSIIAFRSTARQGSVSRITPQLGAGAVVTVPRMDTHFLVTEYGAVNLKGKSTKERAEAVIGLAHPKFRRDLERAGNKLGLL